MQNRRRDVKVLIVEDELLLAMHLEDIITGLGSSTAGPVARLDEALALIEEDDNISVAVLDVRLRDNQDVYRAAERLQGMGIPFILTTAYGSDEVDPRFSKVPVVKKPFTQKELETKLRSVLRAR